MKSETIPEKLSYRLDEVCRLAGLEAKTIEKWENDFPFLHAGLVAGGHKIFRQRDLEIILRLKELLIIQGLTTAGAKRKIEEEYEARGRKPVHPDRLKKVLHQVRDELQEIASSLEKGSKKI